MKKKQKSLTFKSFKRYQMIGERVAGCTRVPLLFLPLSSTHLTLGLIISKNMLCFAMLTFCCQKLCKSH